MDKFTNKYKFEMAMLKEENRLATFKKWIFKDEEYCNAHKMAEAGFYFVGDNDEPDSVKCFLCEKALDGWEAEDDPWSEHLKHAPKCTFASLGQPEHALEVKQYLRIQSEKVRRLLEKACDDANEEATEQTAKIISQLKLALKVKV